MQSVRIVNSSGCVSMITMTCGLIESAIKLTHTQPQWAAESIDKLLTANQASAWTDAEFIQNTLCLIHRTETNICCLFIIVPLILFLLLFIHFIFVFIILLLSFIFHFLCFFLCSSSLLLYFAYVFPFLFSFPHHHFFCSCLHLLLTHLHFLLLCFHCFTSLDAFCRIFFVFIFMTFHCLCVHQVSLLLFTIFIFFFNFGVSLISFYAFFIPIFYLHHLSFPLFSPSSNSFFFSSFLMICSLWSFIFIWLFFSSCFWGSSLLPHLVRFLIFLPFCHLLPLCFAWWSGPKSELSVFSLAGGD